MQRENGKKEKEKKKEKGFLIEKKGERRRSEIAFTCDICKPLSLLVSAGAAVDMSIRFFFLENADEMRLPADCRKGRKINDNAKGKERKGKEKENK